MKMIHRAMFVLIVVVAGRAGISCAAQTTTDSLATVKTNIDEKRAVLVDVREKSEWDDGHIAGAIFLPLSELNRGLDGAQLATRLPKDKMLYTHCVVGKRSLTAANILERYGFKVYSLKPGYKELIAAGFTKANP